MPWFQVDDNLCFHPKTESAGNAAMGLWVRAGSWCMQNLTDGWVPVDMARKLGSRSEAARLVDAGLWEAKDDGYQFHEWTGPGRQRSRVKVEADREATRERQRRAREKAEREKAERGGSAP